MALVIFYPDTAFQQGHILYWQPISVWKLEFFEGFIWIAYEHYENVALELRATFKLFEILWCLS